MSKRYVLKSSHSTAPFTKRRRISEFGAPNKDDAQKPPRDTVNAQSSSTSTRNLKPPTVASLNTLAARAFARNFSIIYATEEGVERTRPQLQALPDAVANRLFDVMKTICPGYIPHAVISSYFLRGPAISLSKELTHVNKHTVRSISRSDGKSLRKIELTNFPDISDSAFASIFPKLPNLRHLNLKGCTKVGEATVSAVARNCPLLTYANLNHTSTTPAALSGLLFSCPELEVLKISALPKMTHAFLASLRGATTTTGDPVGAKLKNLKLRLITTPNLPLDVILQNLPSLETLDVSWTELQRLPTNLGGPGSSYPAGLKKLSLMSVPVKPAELPPFLSHFKDLVVLHIGAIGGSDFPSLSNMDLDQLTDVLKNLMELQTVSLARNRKLGGLGGSQRELARFVRLVGRRCQVLSLANIPNLKSSVLEALLPLTGGREESIDAVSQTPSVLRDLDLSNTAVDDGAVPYLASCKNLTRLNLEATKMSGEGILGIIDGCQFLEEVALEKCRRVDREDRRRIFDVWRKSRGIESKASH